MVVAEFLGPLFLVKYRAGKVVDGDDCDIEQKNRFDSELIYFILINRLVHGV